MAGETSLSVNEIVQSIEESSKDADPQTKLEIKALARELKRPKTFCIMACGLTGVGKSTLLNGIAGEYIFEVGDTEPTTMEVAKKELKKDNYKLILCDTPGFADGLGNEEEYLKGIKAQCASVDTLFYCVSVNATRAFINDDDCTTLKTLKLSLSKRVWQSCVIVLTLADSVLERVKSKGLKSNDEIEKKYNEIIKTWETKVEQTFSKAGINIKANKIPIVHAGSAVEPKLLKSDPKPWLTVLWQAVYDKSPFDGQAVLFCFTFSRYEDNEKEDTKDEKEDTKDEKEDTKDEKEDTKEKKKESVSKEPPPLHEQKIYADKESLNLKLKSKFPRIGATIGATIGALAIGIPTFGVAAGVGLLLGGLIGGGIGVGVGAGATKVYDKVQEHKLSKKKE